eukprot:COSAG02_NODE_2159_length_9628_cov_7.080596_4_plen_149_part_00
MCAFTSTLYLVCLRRYRTERANAVGGQEVTELCHVSSRSRLEGVIDRLLQYLHSRATCQSHLQRKCHFWWPWGPTAMRTSTRNLKAHDNVKRQHGVAMKDIAEASSVIALISSMPTTTSVATRSLAILAIGSRGARLSSRGRRHILNP